MFSKLVALYALVASTQAGLLPEYSHAVSSQSVNRYVEAHSLLDSPKIVAPVAYQAPVAYHSAPVAYHSAPVAYHSTPVAYHSSAPVAYQAPVAHEAGSYPKYEYNYSVADSHTGDKKSLSEVRDGDVVKGSYSFQEADGSIRTVEYTADPHHGFNAVVHNTAPTAAPVVVKAEPVLYKSPPVVSYYH